MIVQPVQPQHPGDAGRQVGRHGAAERRAVAAGPGRVAQGRPLQHGRGGGEGIIVVKPVKKEMYGEIRDARLRARLHRGHRRREDHTQDALADRQRGRRLPARRPMPAARTGTTWSSSPTSRRRSTGSAKFIAEIDRPCPQVYDRGQVRRDDARPPRTSTASSGSISAGARTGEVARRRGLRHSRSIFNNMVLGKSSTQSSARRWTFSRPGATRGSWPTRAR